MAYGFKADENVREAALRCSREQLDDAVRQLSEEIDSDLVTAVHEARKAIKKERALLRLLRGTLPRESGPRRIPPCATPPAASPASGTPT